MLRKCVVTSTFGGSLSHKLTAIAAAGFDGIELHCDDIASANDVMTVISILKDLNLSIDVIQPLRNIEGLTAHTFVERLDDIERYLDMTQDLGSHLILACSNLSPGAIGDRNTSAHQLNIVATRAAKRNVRVAFEALSYGAHIRTWRDAWDVVERASHSHLGIALDSFQTLTIGDSLSDAIGIVPADRIFLVQLADGQVRPNDLVHASRHRRRLPGDGELDVREFLADVLRLGYPGPLSLEVFSDQLRDLDPHVAASWAMASLEDVIALVTATA